MDDQVCKLAVWDQLRLGRFHRPSDRNHYRRANGMIIVYDVTDRDSFNAVHNWFSEVEKNARENVACILLGNKADLEQSRDVSFEEGLELAEHYGCKFLEISAKNG